MQKVPTYHGDRQTFKQRITKKCVKNEDFAKVSGRLKKLRAVNRIFITQIGNLFAHFSQVGFVFRIFQYIGQQVG